MTPEAPPEKNIVTKRSELCIHGWGIDLAWAPITESVFRRLTIDGVTDEEIGDYLGSIESVGGALNGRCAVYVNERKVKDVRLGLKEIETVQVGGNAEYLLVNENWEKGEFGFTEIEGDFDARKLQFSLVSYVLKDATIYDIAYFGYDADEPPEWDQDTSSKETNFFVITRQGARHPVKFIDE